METIIYGGTFDPPTQAHKEIIEVCLDRPQTAEVWIMPSADRHDKPKASSARHRITMVQHMIDNYFAADNRVRLCRVEVDELSVPTQTAITVQYLKTKYPDRLFRFVFGVDTYNVMPSWSLGYALQSSLPMLIVNRQGYKLDSKSSLETIDIPTVISSTKIRDMIAANYPAERFVCKPIIDYIYKNNLYVVQ